MFIGCTSLVNPPAFQSTTGSSTGRYQGMFYNCEKLESITLLDTGMDGQNDYGQMLYGCSSLSTIDVMFTGAYTTTSFMFWTMGVSSTGTFRCPTGADVGVRSPSGIPSGWTIEYKS